MEPALAVLVAESYEKHLTNLGINPKDYDKVYEQAVLLYNEKEIQGPFGIDEIIQGAKKFLDKDSTLLPKQFTMVKKEKIQCSACNGTGLEFGSDGRIIYEQVEGKKKAKHCNECYDS